MLTEKEEMLIRTQALVKLGLAIQLAREALGDVRLLDESELSLAVAIEELDKQIDTLDPEHLVDDEVLGEEELGSPSFNLSDNDKPVLY